MRRTVIVLTCLALMLCMSGAAMAATFYWDGGTNTDWDTNTNWDTAANLAGGDPVGIPVAGDDVVIYKRNNQPTIPAGGTAPLAGVQFDTVTQAEGGAGDITLTCTGTLNMQAATTITLVDGGDNSATISGAGGISGAGALDVVNADAGGGTGGADLVVDATCPVTLATATLTLTSAVADDIVEIAGNINDGGVAPPALGLDKTGAGRAVISGDNSNLDGQIDIHGGVLETSGANATVLGAGAVAPVFLTGGSTLTVGTAINAAAWMRTIQVDGNSTIASNGQTFEIDGAVLFLGSNTLTLSGDTDFTISSVIGDGANTANITINMTASADRVTLSGVNTYDGTTTITQGILLATNAASLGADTGNTTIGAAGTLELSGGITIPAAEDITANGGAPNTIVNVAGDNTIAAPIATATGANKYSVDAGSLTISGIISGAQDIELLGGNSLILSAANTYTGLTTITNGTLRASNSASLGTDAGNTVIAINGSLELTGGITIPAAEDITANGGAPNTIVNVAGDNIIAAPIATATAANKYSVDAGSLTISGIISGAQDIELLGGNSLILSAANTYTGLTTITNGTLRASNSASLGTDAGNTVIAATGSLELTGGITIPAAEDITANGGAPSTIVNVAGDNTIAAPIVTATAANKYEITAGTLTISGVISGTEAVTKLGANDLTFSGINTYDGLTTVSAGTLLINAVMADANDGGVTVATGATLGGTGTIKSDVTVQTGAFVAPGDGGVGTLTTAAGTASAGNVTFQGTGKLMVDLVNATKDLFAIGGNLVLPAGTALVELEAGYIWQGASDPYQVVTIAGTYNPAGGAVFQDTDLPDANWSVVSNADTDIQLHYTPPVVGVPTLGEWGLIIFALLLAGFTIMRMKSQRSMMAA